MRYVVYRSKNGFGTTIGFQVGPESKEPTNADMIASFHAYVKFQESDALKYAEMFRDYLNKLEEAKDKAAESIKLGE